MRSHVPLALLLLCAGAALAGPLDCPEPNPPAKDGATGAALSHTFALRNAGAAPLRVVGIDAGCACVRRDLGRDALAPGESTELRVEVNTLTVPHGSHGWPVAVRYECGGQSGRLDLTLRANLRAEVSAKPAALAFSTAGAAEQTVQLQDVRPTPLSITGARTTSPHIAVERTGVRDVVVRVAADTPAGDHAETLVLATDDPTRPELRIPVRVLKHAAGGIVAAPDAVRLRFAAGHGALSAAVQLRSPGSLVEIERAESTDPAVSVACGSGAAPVAALRVKVAPPADRPEGTTEVRVLMRKPAGATAVIPVSWGRAGGD